MILVALALLGLIIGIAQKLKAGRVGGAPQAKTGDVAARGPAAAGPKGAVSVEGNVLCQQPLMSPVSGTPCLWFSVKVTATWKDGDTEKSKEFNNEKVAAQFAIDDGSGPVWIDAREGGDFEPCQTKSETKSPGLLGGITGQDLMFGNYRVQTGAFNAGTKYRVEEKVLPVVQRMYACGKAADGGGAITSPSWRSLILSNKSRDEILGSAQKTAKICLIGSPVALAAGVALAVIGGSGSSDAAPTTSSSAATPAAAETAAANTATAAAATPAKAPVKAAGVGAPAKGAAAAPAATGAAAAAPSGAAAAGAAAAPSAKAAAPTATAAPATKPSAAPTAAAKPPAKK
jgi:hypothetical protein